jgi:hypothetical protein
MGNSNKRYDPYTSDEDIYLLLGISGAGTTVIYHQFLFSPYNSSKRSDKYIISDIHKSIVKKYNSLLFATKELGYSLSEINNEISFLRCAHYNGSISSNLKQLSEYMRSVWCDTRVQTMLREHASHQSILEAYNLKYYSSRIDTIFDKNYALTELDLLYSCRETNGCHTNRIQFGEKRIDIRNVSSITNAWWYSTIPSAKAIFYCVSLMGFCQYQNHDGQVLNWLSIDLCEFLKLVPLPQPVYIILTHGDVLQELIPSLEINKIRECAHMGSFSSEYVTVTGIGEYIMDLLQEKAKERTLRYMYGDIHDSKRVCDDILKMRFFTRGVDDPKYVRFRTPMEKRIFQSHLVWFSDMEIKFS